ncbi:MOFRL family protein, partial [Cupriavidus necator]
APVALISGGECTVNLAGGGGPTKAGGGVCSYFVVWLGFELDGLPGVLAIAADTEGIDGSEDNAGALA